MLFYCVRDPQQKARRDPTSILGSIARQLACLTQIDNLLPTVEALYDDLNRDGLALPLDCYHLIELIISLVEVRKTTYIIIDGLDECEEPERKMLLSSMDKMIKLAKSTVKVFIASRDEVNIKGQLKGGPHLQLTTSKTEDDIDFYIETIVNERAGDLICGAAPGELLTLIKDKLGSGAEGMYVWLIMMLYRCSYGS